MKKIVVGMSGGVDSSMSLVLLRKMGYEPVGVSLKLTHWKNENNKLKENVCCTAESFDIAAAVCKKLGFEYHIYDVSKTFQKEVIDYFISDLKIVRTPNPCVKCNRYLKFKKLLEFAKKHNINYVSTGHYAKIVNNNGKYELHRAKDLKKDQTYGLCFLPQKWLKNIILP
jgi:tRNA-specific 2-thiouridylase